MARAPVHVQLRNLDLMADYVSALDKEQFAEQYPGWYLVAMGLISTEQIAGGHPAARLARRRDSEETIPLRLDESPRHRLGQPHPLAGSAFQFPSPVAEPLLLGRGEHCAICVPDESVSDEHCRVQVLADGLLIVDAGSTNGTSINLQRLQGEQMDLLSDGDMLTIGRYSFQLLSARTLYSTLALIRALDEP